MCKWSHVKVTTSPSTVNSIVILKLWLSIKALKGDVDALSITVVL